MEGIDPPQVPSMVNPYVNAAGRYERSIKALAPLLHPGDILPWEHHEGSERGPHAGGRSSGHTQTIMSIDRSGSQLKEIDVLQGNQPLPMLERADPLPSKAEVAEVENEARKLGHATRVRLDTLDAQTAKTRGAAGPATAESIRATLSVLRSGQGSTNPAVVAQVFMAVSAAFEGTAPRPGSSGGQGEGPQHR